MSADVHEPEHHRLGKLLSELRASRPAATTPLAGPLGRRVRRRQAGLAAFELLITIGRSLPHAITLLASGARSSRRDRP